VNGYCFSNRLLEKYPGIAGVSPAVAPQRAVGIALPMDALETGIDLKATISSRTPRERRRRFDFFLLTC
jgi:hypothetical protein